MPHPTSTTRDVRFLIPALVLFLLGAALPFASPRLHIPSEVLRWLAILLFCVFAIRRHTITPWIFAAMLAGAEIGVDAPVLAVHLRVFSDIFLRLIKTIVAPLILAVLITGIAGHGDLKSVGRIGLKSLIFFEIATTLALVIGLVAINISRAGVGLSLPAAPSSSTTIAPVASAPHWQDFLLHAFPENIAKSVVEDQILQVAVFAIFFGIALACLTRENAPPC